MAGTKELLPRPAGESGAALGVRVLGPFELTVGDRPVRVSSDRIRSLIAVLAMSAGELLSAETIGDRVWGNEPPESIRRSVQTLVARIRQLLGVAAVVTRPGGYQWGGRADDVDAVRFARLLDGASFDRTRLDQALALWRGTPFEGVRSDWLTGFFAPQLEERYLTALEQRLDLDFAAGRYGELTAELRELTARYPLRESLWARLLTALAHSGRPAEALACYETIRLRLAGELGVDPGPGLQELYTRLLAADAQNAPPVEPAPAPLQLPADIRGFTGRTAVLQALDRLMPRQGPAPTARPIVIAAVDGAGGIGKTAVAVHWAHRVRSEFPDGQLYLNLHGYGPGRPVAPAAALDVLLRGLGVPGEDIPAGVDVRSAMLRSKLAGRRMLMLLDNARDAEQIRPLLPGSGCLVLITSRNQLRGLVVREGAHRITLDQMAPDEARAMLAGRFRRSGVRYDEDTLARLVELCGRLPLALAIAAQHASQQHASRQPAISLDALADQLGDERARLDALATDTTDDVRAVFSWSYRGLPATAARMFRLLGVHPGAEIGTGAAAALLGGTVAQAHRLLDQLVDVHLVEQRGSGRYGQHDLLRSYAAELAAAIDGPEESGLALDRVLGWYLHSARNARLLEHRGDVFGPLEPLPPGVQPQTFQHHREGVDWYAAETAALTAAIRTAAATGRHRVAYGLVHRVWHDLVRRRAFDLIDELLGLAQQASHGFGDRLAEGFTENLFGMTCTQLLQYQRALEHFERALALFEREESDRGQARVLGNIAVVLRNLGQLGAAVEHHERSLAIKRRIGDQPGEAATLNNLASAYVEVGRLPDALAAATRAVRIYRDDNQPVGERTALDSLGQVQLALGDHDRAIDSHLRSLRLHRDLDDRWGEGIVLTNLGHAYRAAGRHDRARQTWLQAVALFDTIGASDSYDFSRSQLLELIDSVSAAHTT